LPFTFFADGGISSGLPEQMRSIRFSIEQCIPELLSLHKSKRKMFGIYLFISGQEIIFAVLIALLLFGSKEIPKLARTFGKGMKEFRRATEDIKKEFESSTPDITEDFKAIKKNLTKDADEIKRNLTKDANEIAKGVKKNLDSD
jgi:sec-independent protein translocase protein TatA